MQTLKISFSLLILAAVAILPGCDGGRCIRGNHDMETEYRNVEYFDGVITEGSWDVSVHEDSIYYVVIEAESNLLPYIGTSVRNNDLVIRTRDHRCINNREPIHIHVYAPSVSHATLEGSGNMDIERISGSSTRLAISGSGDISAGVWADDFEAQISGSGEMHLEGETETSEMEISGSGNIKAYNLLQGSCFATISGSGDMYLHVLTLLDVRILGSGNVYYKGNPQLHTSILGSGEVIHTW